MNAIRHLLGAAGGAVLLMKCGAPAGVVADWNTAFEQSVRIETTPPALAARNLAILHGAIHDAICAGPGGCAPLLLGAPPQPPPGLVANVAAAATAHTVCAALFPSRQAAFDAQLAATLAGQTAGPGVSNSLAFGRRVAGDALAARADDGSATSVHYVPKTGPGQWRRTTLDRPPELPQWPGVRPFVLAGADQFRPPPPPGPDTVAFAAALAEVRDIGACDTTKRTPEQTEIARFWSDFSYTSTPPGHWNRIARDQTRARGLGLRPGACLFAVLNLAMADAGLACFEGKYHYNYWRPVTALRFTGDDAWASLLPSPSHPEYPSGHATFSAAAAAVLEAGLPDPGRFPVTSDALPAVTRAFETYDDAVAEIARSRVYGGIHFGFSGEAGRMLGRQIAQAVLARHPLTPPRAQ